MDEKIRINLTHKACAKVDAKPNKIRRNFLTFNMMGCALCPVWNLSQINFTITPHNFFFVVRFLSCLAAETIFYGMVCSITRKRTFLLRLRGILRPLIMTMGKSFKLYLKWYAVAKWNRQSSQWESPDRLNQYSRHSWWTNAWVPLHRQGVSNLKRRWLEGIIKFLDQLRLRWKCRL